LPVNPQAAQNYLRTKVLTATPEQLQLMLYDGAIRFAEQGRAALEKKDYATSHRTLTQAQKILVELTSTLKRDIYPELCNKLAALYTYAHRNLVEANVHHHLEPVEEALKVLRYQRDTWAMLMEQLGKTKAAEAASKLDVPSPDARMEESICMQA
jgi:flagellar secretion chaperone FliS